MEIAVMTNVAPRSSRRFRSRMSRVRFTRTAQELGSEICRTSVDEMTEGVMMLSPGSTGKRGADA
jgi:hypothetical protein